MTSPAELTTESFPRAVQSLTEEDPHLRQIYTKHGPPPMWTREPGFPTLIHIILEQQVSLASARAAFDRLLAAVDPLTPAAFLSLDDAALRTIGFSRQKTRYARLLADALATEQLDLAALHHLPDEHARDQLTQLKGIGPWTADIYLLMALRRPDVWPVGDRALVVAAREVCDLPRDPSATEMLHIGEKWRPWRAVAARLLWHHYLSTPRVR